MSVETNKLQAKLIRRIAVAVVVAGLAGACGSSVDEVTDRPDGEFTNELPEVDEDGLPISGGESSSSDGQSEEEGENSVAGGEPTKPGYELTPSGYLLPISLLVGVPSGGEVESSDIELQDSAVVNVDVEFSGDSQDDFNSYYEGEMIVAADFTVESLVSDAHNSERFRATFDYEGADTLVIVSVSYDPETDITLVSIRQTLV